mgnify:CR=1 FL=1
MAVLKALKNNNGSGWMAHFEDDNRQDSREVAVLAIPQFLMVSMCYETYPTPEGVWKITSSAMRNWDRPSSFDC